MFISNVSDLLEPVSKCVLCINLTDIILHLKTQEMARIVRKIHHLNDIRKHGNIYTETCSKTKIYTFIRFHQ